MTTIKRPAAEQAPITARYGNVSKIHPNGHSGTDFGWWGGNPNRPVYSPIDGTVTEAFYGNFAPGGLGGWITIVSADGVYKTQLGHLNRNSNIGVKVGDKVKAGQHVANYGVPTTGRSTGSHLHVNFWVKGVRSDVMKYVGKEQTGAVKPPSKVEASPTGWDGVSTLFKGNYSTQADGQVHTVPVGGPWPSQVVKQKGVTLAQVSAYTQKLANSKWAGTFLQPGGSYLTPAMLTGGAKFYAGGVYATADVVAILTQREAEANAEAALKNKQVKEAEEKEKAALLAIAKEDAANAEAAKIASLIVSKNDVEIEEATLNADDAETVKVEAEKELARVQAEKLEAEKEFKLALDKAMLSLEVSDAELTSTLMESKELANPQAPLAGLLAGRPEARKKAYYAFATTALIVSFGPDILIAGVLSEAIIPTASAYIALASSLLLKVGTAFGFVAASNTTTTIKTTK